MRSFFSQELRSSGRRGKDFAREPCSARPVVAQSGSGVRVRRSGLPQTKNPIRHIASGGVNDRWRFELSKLHHFYWQHFKDLTPSPHPYAPTGATMLLFGIGIFFGAGRDASGGKKR